MTPIDDFFKDDIQIPSPPSIAVRIIEAVKQDDASFNVHDADIKILIR